MAGAGFKTFNTGDVLTASDVNTYLMQQTVMVFASAAARTTALGANVAEGMLSYLKDTDQVEVYNGTSWVASDDPNAIQNSIFDAKGDLIVGTGNDTYVRQAIGSNGSVLIADSSQADGLQWGDNYGFTAGKNKIINGDFRINQRSFSSTTTSGTYGFDRWIYNYTSGTTTYSAQTFTLGTAPVSGYEAINFARVLTSGQTGTNANAIFRQFIESVRTFAGQTVTVSFWAKAASGTPKIAVELGQNFGTGGSPSSEVNTYAGQATLSTSWARYSLSVAIPSISGKTIGTNNNDALLLTLWLSGGSDFNTRTGSLGLQNNTFDIWGVQVEAGSTATPFQTATGTIQGELAACQRYYFRQNSTSAFTQYAMGEAVSTTVYRAQLVLPVIMRVAPTALEFSALEVSDYTSGFSSGTFTIDTALTSNAIAAIAYTHGSAALTQFRMMFLKTTASNGYIGVTAEL